MIAMSDAPVAIYESVTVANGGAQSFLDPRSRWHVVGTGPEPDVHQLARYLTTGTRSALQSLRALPNNWDGFGSVKPSASAVSNATARLPDLYRSVFGGSWVPPHVSANEVGEVAFEWWKDGRKITLYFDDHDMEMLLVWGHDVESDMRHVPDADLASFSEAWNWLRQA